MHTSYINLHIIYLFKRLIFISEVVFSFYRDILVIILYYYVQSTFVVYNIICLNVKIYIT